MHSLTLSNIIYENQYLSDHTPGYTPVISWLKASHDDIVKNHMHFQNAIFIII